MRYNQIIIGILIIRVPLISFSVTSLKGWRDRGSVDIQKTGQADASGLARLSCRNDLCGIGYRIEASNAAGHYLNPSLTPLFTVYHFHRRLLWTWSGHFHILS